MSESVDLNTSLSRALDHAHRCLERDGSVAPMVDVFGQHGRFVINLDTRDDTHKQHSWNVVRLAAVAVDAEATVVLMESWMTTRVDPDAHDTPRPSEDPERLEVIVVVASTRERQQSSIHRIRRHSDGRFRDLVLFTTDGDVQLGGTASELLPPHRPDDSKRRQARDLLEHLGHHLHTTPH